VLLLFALGLEFSLNDLGDGGASLLGAAAIFLALNVGAGIAFGFALGWGGREALVIAGAMGISSSAIATKLLTEFRRLANPESHLVLGIIVVEDVFLALYLAILQPVLEDDHGASASLLSIGKAFAFLLALALVARFGGHAVARLITSDNDELLTICFVGFALLVAGVAEHVGVSEAIGALMAGLVLAEAPAIGRIETLVRSIRDTFAALFFFAFGVVIDPSELPKVAWPIVLAVVITALATALGAVIVARLRGFDRVSAANLACTILARGEFSLIVATLGVAAGLDERLGPFVAGYVLVLALASPLLAKNTGVLNRNRRPQRLPA
jgi:CPA2 family monovalent cation:H+ antiporter-2